MSKTNRGFELKNVAAASAGNEEIRWREERERKGLDRNWRKKLSPPTSKQLLLNFLRKKDHETVEEFESEEIKKSTYQLHCGWEEPSARCSHFQPEFSSPTCRSRSSAPPSRPSLPCPVPARPPSSRLRSEKRNRVRGNLYFNRDKKSHSLKFPLNLPAPFNGSNSNLPCTS